LFASALELAPVFAGFLAGLGVTLLYIIFFVSSLFLIIIILLQEGKGGGFTAAFGGVGTEAFGVKAGGINKLTAVLAGVFVVSALILGVVTKGSGTVATDLEPEVVPGAMPPMQQQPGAPGAQPAGTPPATPPARPSDTSAPSGEGKSPGEGAPSPAPKTPANPPAAPDKGTADKGKAESAPPAKGASTENKG